MKKLITIAALASAALTTQAQASPGMHMKNCVIETMTERVLAETPWLEDLIANDPTMQHEFAVDFLRIVDMRVTAAEWEEWASEDLSWLREASTYRTADDWLIDAFLSCSPATPAGS